MKYLAIALLGCTALVGCMDETHANAPANPSDFHVNKDGLMGNVGGGNGFYSTHWERYTDDQTGQSIICFSSNNGAGGTSLTASCVTERKPQ